MDTSLYIGSNKIEMACGTVKDDRVILKAFSTVELPDQTVINGIITNHRAFKEGMAKIMTDYPNAVMENVRITIASSPAFVKARKVPRLKELQMMEWMEGEFEELNDPENPLVFDYAVLEENKEEGDTAILCAIERSVIEELIILFDEMDISISCINTGIVSQVKFVQHMESARDRTFLLMHMDGQNLDATLYVKGMFTLLNRTRLIGARGSEALGREMEEIVSKLIQFNQGEKNDPIEFIYVSGFREEQKLLTDRNFRSSSVEIRNIAEDGIGMVETNYDSFSLGEYLYVTGNLFKE